ncbi:MAG TPA: hypothetical protein VHP33_26340 [Polyangiaceae bacterium]|nr:hypothetical protein [Polyangiaceae bacterium]
MPDGLKLVGNTKAGSGALAEVSAGVGDFFIAGETGSDGRSLGAAHPAIQNIPKSSQRTAASCHGSTASRLRRCALRFGIPKAERVGAGVT